MTSSFILTGFLGVGKTTMLINSVKEHFKDKNVAVIVNEFGEIGVDNKIIKNVHSEVLEISEGCICCQLAQEFESGVMEIMQKYNPEMILVETSGASEPFPIFISLQNLGIAVEGVICVIDSKNFGSYSSNSTAKYQIGGSNIIVLNKTDLISDDQLQNLEDEIMRIKEQYNIKNTFTAEPVFKSHIILKAQQGVVGKEVFEGVYDKNEVVEILKEHHHHDHTASDAITQQAAYLKPTVSFTDIEKVLQALPRNIYRVKGVVKTTDVDEPLFVNYSFGDATFEPMQGYSEDSILIFIGSDIKKQVQTLTESFDFLIVPQFRVKR